MTIKQLQAFYWAAKLGSFAIAADRLSISQPTLSKRIAELESSLGKALFDRSARRAVLTLDGEVALGDAKLILDAENTLRRKLQRDNSLQGNLRMGIGELTAATWFSRFIRRAAQELPALRIEPLVSQGRFMEAEVERGTLDCAVVAGIVPRRSLASQELPSVSFAWMGAPSLRIKGRTITPETLSTYPVLTFAAPSGQAQLFEEWVASTGATIDRVIGCNSIHAIVELAIAGVGLCLLPQQHLKPILKRGLLREYECRPTFPPLTYRFIWRHDDVRDLVKEVRTLVTSEVNFNLTTPLWTPARGPVA
ncbi:LysR family transcriptional regulator [Hydrogenophaga intermedia]|uniref:LysR family transcriptional regulator n=1 Tax=Hydrogenophaga intermedia TaxID=65786 RepID=A0A1L1PGQ4_HYDIT|nr:MULTISPECIES: LysR family transcriptional regulator [Hydrogenophaga]AOS78011.1 hypothetical protein Q5W_02940 [Hydrogenophaga sp. PBC]CDN86147.1 LysR family transcriptional regulator [Hydrogenophaga intermedia]